MEKASPHPPLPAAKGNFSSFHYVFRGAETQLSTPQQQFCNTCGSGEDMRLPVTVVVTCRGLE
ncbi:hypothetical protein E2C01_023490 [Portunus trituberculatus]|uniref:Uncharacterized protein n=1 Tax=Portunus trituberculatus TaxID=210409 RepID=A0A5B7E829_PORTR|nr:hypothetical protein [Portunus trituberculatus]